MTDIYVSTDTARQPSEYRCYAEVIADIGTDREIVLHTTTWYKTHQLAVGAARRWMKKNVKDTVS